jgi:hypothetical protein
MDVVSKFYIGVDGGKTGGICVIDENQNIVECVSMPLVDSAKGTTYDVNKISDIFDKYPNCEVMLEQAHSMYGNGLKANFTNGELFGVMKTILILKKIPFTIVSAKSWMKKMFEGMIIRDNAKPSIEFCMNKYPNYDFVQSSSGRGKKQKDGLTDATCIALYCRWKNK